MTRWAVSAKPYRRHLVHELRFPLGLADIARHVIGCHVTKCASVTWRATSACPSAAALIVVGFSAITILSVAKWNLTTSTEMNDNKLALAVGGAGGRGVRSFPLQLNSSTFEG